MTSRRLFGSKALRNILAAACAAAMSLAIPAGAVDFTPPSQEDYDDWNIPFWEKYWEEYIEELAEIEAKEAALTLASGGGAAARDRKSGEWPWWNSPEDASLRTLHFDERWTMNADDRQIAGGSRNKKGADLSDRRSCENHLTPKACKKWLATPHEILFLPPKSDAPPPILKHAKTDADKELDQLMKDKIDEMRYRARWKMKGGDNPWADDPEFHGCPFDTVAECMVWRTKPTVVETISDRRPGMHSHAMDTVIVLARAGNRITPEMDDAKPLISRYKTLLAASRACCTGGIIYNLESAGAPKETVFAFMMNDAGLSRFGERCLMTTDREVNRYSSDLSMAQMITGVRNTCLCRRREFYETLLAPFAEIAEASDEFASSPFNITYLDGMKRQMTADANAESKIVLDQLKNCKK